MGHPKAQEALAPARSSSEYHRHQKRARAARPADAHTTPRCTSAGTSAWAASPIGAPRWLYGPAEEPLHCTIPKSASRYGERGRDPRARPWNSDRSMCREIYLWDVTVLVSGARSLSCSHMRCVLWPQHAIIMYYSTVLRRINDHSMAWSASGDPWMCCSIGSINCRQHEAWSGICVRTPNGSFRALVGSGGSGMPEKTRLQGAPIELKSG